MQEREKQSRLYNKLAFILTNERFQAITRLGIPKGMMDSPIKDIWDFLQAKEKTKENIDWEYTEDEAEIKLRLREWNILHFAQAAETPLATKEWEQALDPDKTLTEDIDSILKSAISNGTDLHPDSICLLQEMRQVISTPCLQK